MENVITRVISLPATIKAMTILDNDGDYNIYLNVGLSWEEQRAAYKHEMRHIKFGDFFKKSYGKTLFIFLSKNFVFSQNKRCLPTLF